MAASLQSQDCSLFDQLPDEILLKIIGMAISDVPKYTTEPKGVMEEINILVSVISNISERCLNQGIDSAHAHA